MKLKKAFSWIAALAFMVTSVGVFPAIASASASASPFVEVGPKAVLSNSVNSDYGLFTCQVAGQNPGVTCYDPYQMRHAYNIDSLINAGYDGKGKTIIIVDAYQSPNIVSQLNYYDNFYGLPGLNGLGNPEDPSLGTFTQVAPDGLTPFDSNDGNMIGWAEEISLDVLWAHAIAPGANIVLDLAKSNQDADILSATKYAVDNNLGDVISQSFGENESCMDPSLVSQQHQVFADATSKGITLFASSGDSGAAQPTCDGNSYVKAASTPASDPLVTAVGGTTLDAARYCLVALGCDPTANPTPGTYFGEVAWNEFDNSSASGGGFSVLYNEPSYQQGTNNGGKALGVPDVAYNAAVYHGVLTYLNIPGIPVGMYLFGGTSAGSPQWAALLAIADQKAGHDLGFINADLYRIGQAQAAYSASLHDITSGNNSVLEEDIDSNPVTIDGFSATKGWDAVTGLGSPSGVQVVNYLIQHYSQGDGKAAIATSAPHRQGKPSNPGHMNSH